MRAFLSYYKWHIFFIALFVVCTVIFAISSCTKTEPDLVINVVSPGRINVQTFNDTKDPLVRLLTHDADGDGKKTLNLASYPYDRQSDMDEAFDLLANPNDSDIIITTEETLTAYENKEKFVDMREFVPEINSDKYKTLEDSSGRIYGISLEGNDMLEKMGFFDTSNLYISVIADEGEEISKEKKNARNITIMIIREYNY